MLIQQHRCWSPVPRNKHSSPLQPRLRCGIVPDPYAHSSITHPDVVRVSRVRLTRCQAVDDVSKQVEAAKQALEQAAAALHHQQLQQQPAAGAAANAQLLQLWEQQQQLYQRELRRWDEERAAWDRKEAALQEQIRSLQEVVLSLALQQAATPRYPEQLPVVTATAEHVTTLPSSRSPTLSDSIPVPSSTANSDTAAPATPAWTQLFADGPAASVAEAAEATGTSPPLEGPSNPAGPSQGLSQNTISIMEQLSAAMAAVEETDVLTDDLAAFHAEWASGSHQGTVDTVATPTAILTGQPVSSSSSSSSSNGNGSNTAAVESTAGPSELSVLGGPPVLVPGSDDIFWMSKLHGALVQEGYFPGDEDIQDWYFGSQTQSALLTFQACSGLEETGVTDLETWVALLGPQGVRDVLQGVPGDRAAPESANKGDRLVIKDWPNVHEGDGGRFVHALHVLLEKAGCWPGEDDYQWWWFGDSTLIALKTFQVGAGLPESGVCDRKTWLALMGPDAKPDDINDVWGNNGFDADLADDRKGVFLIGEQRWEDPAKIKRLREQQEAAQRG